MPHITVEYSANVAEHHDIQSLITAVHNAAVDHGLPPLDGLRTRAACRDHYIVADGDSDFAFIAIHTRIGPGRSDAEKTSFFTQLLDAAQKQIEIDNGPLAIMWSVELNEIVPANRINRNGVRDRIQQRQS